MWKIQIESLLGTGLASLDVVRYVTAHHPNLPITMTSQASLPSVRGKMIDIQFAFNESHFNGMENHYGNVPLDQAVALFLKV